MKINIGPYRANRKIGIRIDPYDTWNMDHTLAMLIVPMLRQLREQQHGIPGAFSPAHSTETHQLQFPFMDEDHDAAFARGEARWLEVMDKMIWSFEQIISEDSLTSDVPAGYHGSAENYQRAIQEGIDLFAKYYRNLWD